MSSRAFKSLLRRFLELTSHSRASLGAPRLGVSELCYSLHPETTGSPPTIWPAEDRRGVEAATVGQQGP